MDRFGPSRDPSGPVGYDRPSYGFQTFSQFSLPRDGRLRFGSPSSRLANIDPPNSTLPKTPICHIQPVNPVQKSRLQTNKFKQKQRMAVAETPYDQAHAFLEYHRRRCSPGRVGGAYGRYDMEQPFHIEMPIADWAKLSHDLEETER